VSPDTRSLQQHYSQDGLLERILGALQACGKDPAALTQDALAPVDEFHTRGRHATRELAELAGFRADESVLDVGSGLGGPARFLAANYGCQVTGVDLMAEFCAVANELSQRCGLAGRTRFQPGNALGLPFPDASFDAAWTIQVQMNISDKERFYGEIARVLRPGGRFVFQDICAGNGAPLDFPVAWASEAAHSHLVPPDAMRKLVAGTGLQERNWRDVTAGTIAWRRAQLAKGAGTAAASPLGMHLVMGAQFAQKQANALRATEDGRLAFVQGLFEKPV
jgi:SAM-dependent methyltransferase